MFRHSSESMKSAAAARYGKEVFLEKKNEASPSCLRDARGGLPPPPTELFGSRVPSAIAGSVFCRTSLEIKLPDRPDQSRRKSMIKVSANTTEIDGLARGLLRKDAPKSGRLLPRRQSRTGEN